MNPARAKKNGREARFLKGSRYWKRREDSFFQYLDVLIREWLAGGALVLHGFLLLVFHPFRSAVSDAWSPVYQVH